MCTLVIVLLRVTLTNDVVGGHCSGTWCVVDGQHDGVHTQDASYYWRFGALLPARCSSTSFPCGSVGAVWLLTDGSRRHPCDVNGRVRPRQRRRHD